MASLDTAFRRALDTAALPLADVARGIGRSYRTLLAYVDRSRFRRRVTPEAVEGLAAFLRGRAQALNQAADDLEAAFNHERRRK